MSSEKGLFVFYVKIYCELLTICDLGQLFFQKHVTFFY